MTQGTEQTLEQLVDIVRAHPGVRNKAPISLVSEVLGVSDWMHGPGDDGAVVAAGDTTIVVGGEALWPPFVEADPYGAGIAAVLANVNDVAAMGAYPLAIVDTIIGREPLARRALEGMRFASDLYQVPIVGGHLTVRDGPPAISAFGVGRVGPPGGTGSRTGSVLSVRNAAPGQALIVACCTEGTMRPDFNFFRSFDERGRRLAGDIRVLPEVAAGGDCVAAKDISMAGLVGSLAMLLEHRRLGVTVDLEAVPRPGGVDLGVWLTTFPCVGFLLCAPPGRETSCLEPFRRRGLGAEVVGTLDASGEIRLRRHGQVATVFDLLTEPITGLGGAPA
ncbi:MAG: AIR synthase related protein [Acidimicrobiales bacterium]